MEIIFKVYSAKMQNVLFYSALAMQFEVTKEKRCQKDSCLNYSRFKTISNFLGNSWLSAILLLYTYTRNGQCY